MARVIRSARVESEPVVITYAPPPQPDRLPPIAANRPSDQFDGRFELPSLHGQQAQQVQGLRIVGLSGQHLTIDSLGFGQLAGLMMASALRQCVRDVQHIRFIVVTAAGSTSGSTSAGRRLPDSA